MDKKSKILVGLLVVAILISVFFTYYRSFVSRDFIITEEEAEGEISE